MGNVFIERNPEKCFGMPSLIGRRLTVYDIVTQINGEGLEALDDYEITSEQAVHALKYCVARFCELDHPERSFCDGCVLRVIVEGGSDFVASDYYEITHEDGTKTTVSQDGNSFFLEVSMSWKKKRPELKPGKWQKGYCVNFFRVVLMEASFLTGHDFTFFPFKEK